MSTWAPAPENVLQQLVDALNALGARGRRPDKKVSQPVLKNHPVEIQVHIYLKPMISLIIMGHQNMWNFILDSFG